MGASTVDAGLDYDIWVATLTLSGACYWCINQLLKLPSRPRTCKWHGVLGPRSTRFRITLLIILSERFSRLQSFVGVESLESHKTRIKHAKSDIEDFVENLDYEICPHELKQLEEQRLGIDKCLEICTYSFDSIDLIQVKTEENGKVSEADKPTAFPGLYEKGSFSTINNYSTGDAVVFMVSTDERTIHGSNKMLGWRSRYLTGHVNDQSVQQISKDFALMNTGHLERKESSAGKSTYTSCALIFKCVK